MKDFVELLIVTLDLAGQRHVVTNFLEVIPLQIAVLLGWLPVSSLTLPKWARYLLCSER